MCYDDFIKYYVTMGIAKLHTEYVTSILSIPVEKNTKMQIIQLNVNENENHCYLQLYQINPRILLSDGTYQETVLSFIMLVDINFNYIDSVASSDMHIAVEKKLTKGVYYLLCDVNYRYANENGKNHEYNVTCYSQYEVGLNNVTDSIKSDEKLKNVVMNYCKQKVTPIKDKDNGINIYISKNYNKELPFMVAMFENTTQFEYNVKLDVKSKGKKSFCFYCDDVGSENDTAVIKPLSIGQTVSFCIMKYTLSSLFSLNYTVTKNSNSNNNNKNNDNIENNPVFEEEGEQIDEAGYLYQYILSIDDGKGFTIGLENTSEKDFKLSLTLTGVEEIDPEFKGQTKPIFIIKGNSKRVFNVREIPGADDLEIEFNYA